MKMHNTIEKLDDIHREPILCLLSLDMLLLLKTIVPFHSILFSLY